MSKAEEKLQVRNHERSEGWNLAHRILRASKRLLEVSNLPESEFEKFYFHFTLLGDRNPMVMYVLVA